MTSHVGVLASLSPLSLRPTHTLLPAQPAEIVIAPQSTSVTVGDTVLFSCVAKGYPLPNITWYDPTGILANDSRVTIYDLPLYEGGYFFLHSVLEICSVELEDGGNYSCFANNSAGSSISEFTVEVNDDSKFSVESIAYTDVIYSYRDS